jgi:hypothetical protein
MSIQIFTAAQRRAQFDYLCPDCKSRNVAHDAAVHWDRELQRFVLATVHDIATCQDCDCEGDASRFFVKVEG